MACYWHWLCHTSQLNADFIFSPTFNNFKGSMEEDPPITVPDSFFWASCLSKRGREWRSLDIWQRIFYNFDFWKSSQDLPLRFKTSTLDVQLYNIDSHFRESFKKSVRRLEVTYHYHFGLCTRGVVTVSLRQFQNFRSRPLNVTSKSVLKHMDSKQNCFQFCSRKSFWWKNTKIWRHKQTDS